jgi:3',5'-cyclic-AMP phosphodiesterase
LISSSSAPIKILQFSDTHLYADPAGKLMGVNTDYTFRAVAELAKEHNPDVEMVLLTGDLSQDESTLSYKRVADIVRHFSAPVVYLPGNHDVFPTMEEVFTEEGPPFRTERSISVRNWRIILLNSVIPGKVGGHLDRQELTLLDEELTAHQDKHALVCLHHHPLRVGSAWIDTINVDNGDEFFDIIDRHPNVRIVLFGHIHQEFTATHGNVSVYASPSTCVQFAPLSNGFAVDADKKPGYRWFELREDGTFKTGVQRAEGLETGLDLTQKGY